MEGGDQKTCQFHVGGAEIDPENHVYSNIDNNCEHYTDDQFNRCILYKRKVLRQ